MSNEYLAELAQIFSLQASIHDLHPILRAVYPVAIVQDQHFLVYLPQPEAQTYAFQVRKPTPMPVPVGVRAAFPLSEAGAEMACVVTPEVFDEPDGYVTIFHEFIHCHQFTTCELELKNSLSIAREAQARGDFMWEIEYPFPYQDPDFERSYAELLARLAEADPQKGIVSAARQELRAALAEPDWEYLVWQEWKEGFARWLENRMRARLGLPPNHNGSQPPWARVSFYAGGAAYIECLTRSEPGLASDLVALFQRLRS